MKIYFSAPISRVSPESRSHYDLIIATLKKQGHNVLSDHLTNKKPEDLQNQTPEQALEIQHLMTKRKNQADLMIIEASTPSFGIGQEIAYGIQNGKQVIVLHTVGNFPHLLRDEGQELLFVREYSPENVSKVITEAINDAREKMDIRFNFYISPEISRYLDWISQTKKIPRSVYLRGLLEKHMRLEKEFKD